MEINSRIEALHIQEESIFTLLCYQARPTKTKSQGLLRSQLLYLTCNADTQLLPVLQLVGVRSWFKGRKSVLSNSH